MTVIVVVFIVVAVLVVVFAVLMLSLLANFEFVDNMTYDRQLRKDAKNGLVILLTAEQYMAIHEADPKKYKFDEIEARFREGRSKVMLTSREMERLNALRELRKEQKKAAKKERLLLEERARTIDELQHMRAVLGKHIDCLNDENAAKAKEMAGLAAELTASTIKEPTPINLTLNT